MCLFCPFVWLTEIYVSFSFQKSYFMSYSEKKKTEINFKINKIKPVKNRYF